MGMIKEFHYPNLSQRKVLVYNTFFSFILSGCLLGGLMLAGNYYLFYEPVSSVLFLSGLVGFFSGNLLGKFILSRSNGFRLFVTATNLFFIFVAACFFLRNLISPGETDALIRLYQISPLLFIIAMVLVSVVIGMKSNYTLKISCGDFIDNRQFISGYIGFSIVGFSLGIGIAVVHFMLQASELPLVALPIFLLPSIFLLRLPYNPHALYTKEYEGDRDESYDRVQKDQILFVYLIFPIIVVYLFLGFETIIRFHNNPPLTKLAFIVFAPMVMLLGYGLGRLLRLSRWHIYSQALFPLLFLGFLTGAFMNGGGKPLYATLAFFIPSLIAYGIVINHAIRHVIATYGHTRRYEIIEFAHLVIPVPIMAALIFLPISNIWFIILVGVIGLVNIIIPALFHLKRRGDKRVMVLYAALGLFFIPFLAAVVWYYRIPFVGKPYAARVSHFEKLASVDFNDYFVKNRAMIMLDREPVFNLADSEVRNLKRAMVPVALYHPDNKKMLVVHGYQKFFRNPIIGFFPGVSCIDPVGVESVDYHSLPGANTVSTVVRNEDVIWHLRGGRRYNTIVDIPNLLDQTRNPFMFSRERYHIIRDALDDRGVFVQMLSVVHCRSELLAEAIRNLDAEFSHHAVWIFSSTIVIFSSSHEEALVIRPENLARLTSFMGRNPVLKDIFINETHVLAHMLTARLKDLNELTGAAEYTPAVLLGPLSTPKISDTFIERMVNRNNAVVPLFERSPGQALAALNLQVALANNDAILTLLKKTEYAEALEEYDRETSYLIELRKRAEYQVFLKEYIYKMLANKEEYYFAAARRFERLKKWEEARKLYRAVIIINNNNFDAFYRMGLLSITLQDLDNAAVYLQEAMRIRKDHPKVLYQMGVLNFSRGNIKDAIDYFTRAYQLDENNVSLYRYLGLCNERNGNLAEAERFYEKTIQADPGDTDIKARLSSLRSDMKKERGKWERQDQKNETDVEQDAEMPLPVNKSARDLRIRDDDNTLPLMEADIGEGDVDDQEKK